MDRKFQRDIQREHQRLDVSLDRIVEGYHALQKPPTLCHYTRWEGLEGILTSRTIWAVDFRAQRTDEQEFRHADAEILRLAQKMALESSRDELDRQLLESFANRFEHGDGHPAVRAGSGLFIACFCTEADNAHVWDNFANGQRGFAIEFEVLRENFEVPDLGAGFWPVEYDGATMVADVRSAFEAVFTRLRAIRKPRRRPAFEGMAVNALFRIAGKAAMTFKSERFRPEHEIRALFLTRNRGLVPVHTNPRHIAVPLRARAGELPVIRAIHVGAAASADAEQRVSELLARLGWPIERWPAIVRVAATKAA